MPHTNHFHKKRIKLLCCILSCVLLLAACGDSTPPSIPPSPASDTLVVSPAENEPSSSPLSPLEAADSQYTIAWLSDTQYYSKSYPETFRMMTAFLRDNRELLHLGYVVHTGDLVEDYDDAIQWTAARAGMDQLANIPHGVLAGNHDVTGKMYYENFTAYFGEKYFREYPWYGGSFQDNACHYDVLELGATKYIFVYLGHRPGEEAIAWANKVFRAYPGHVGVLLTHAYLDTDSSLLEEGVLLQKEIVRKNKNIYMVLSGHRYNADCVSISFDDDGDGAYDRAVYQCIANYQNKNDLGGGGYIRFLQIDEEAGAMRFITYSPLLEKYYSIHKSATNRNVVLPLPWLVY